MPLQDRTASADERPVGAFRLTLRPAAVLAACALGFAACGGSGTPDGVPFTEPGPTIPATLISQPAVVLDADVQALVNLHAGWMCELQSQTFSEPSDIEVALTEHLRAGSVSRTDYDQFVISMGDKDVRDAVLFAFSKNCLGQ